MSWSKGFVGIALATGLAVALFVTPYASTAPDGLERVATDQGFADSGRESLAANGPLAEYGVRGVDNPRMSTGAAGLVGTLLTFGLAMALVGLLRNARRRSEGSPEPAALHTSRPECSIAAAVLFVLAVVATPREIFWAFGCHAALLAAAAHRAKVPARVVLRGMRIELPIVAFALVLPFASGGDEVGFLGFTLSTDGLWTAWNILAKGTLGVATSILLAASTPVPEILKGLDRLRLPKALTTIAGFMVRYFDVVADDVRRVRIARESRGYDPGWLWEGRALASSAGTLFIRSYERGERVYAAMLARGYEGAMPRMDEEAASGGQWAAALGMPAIGALVAAAAWLAIS